MVSTNCIAVFIRHNDSEFRALVTSICNSLNYRGSYEDVIEDLYGKICELPILQGFNRHYYRGIPSNKMSTYLYPIIRNHVISLLKAPEEKIFRSPAYTSETLDDDDPDIERTLYSNPVALEYEEVLLANAEADKVDGLRMELQDFVQQYLCPKKYRGNKKLSKKSNCTLLDIFNYLYKGYTNKEISDIYGVSQMSVSHYKNKLAKALLRYGFSVKTKRKRKVCEYGSDNVS
jgi:DNA-directed RNA polymerase specialized sigma24 family protein